MVTLSTFKRGLINAARTAFDLFKIIIPVYAFVTILNHTPVIGWIADIFSPVMSLFGLPGTAALALVVAWFVSVYTSIGIIIALNLNVWQLTTIAVMINFAHELIVETAVIRKTGISVLPIISTRISCAVIAGVVMNIVGYMFH